MVSRVVARITREIIGARIRNPIWMTLFGLIIGERLMGVPGMILSPVVLNYLRVKISKMEAGPAVIVPKSVVVDPVTLRDKGIL